MLGSGSRMLWGKPAVCWGTSSRREKEAQSAGICTTKDTPPATADFQTPTDRRVEKRCAQPPPMSQDSRSSNDVSFNIIPYSVDETQ